MFSGSCKTDVTRLTRIAENYKEAIQTHYGYYKEVKSDCSGGNICLFVDSSGSCTGTNTGKTGVDVDVETASKKPGGKPLEPANYYGGAETSFKKWSNLGMAFIMIIYLLISS